MSDTPRIDKNMIRYLSLQIAKIKGIDKRRAAIKELSERHGGRNKSHFELALKSEIERLWIGRKA